MPSLPVFGTESPPVAMITASASIGAAPLLAIVQPRSSAPKPLSSPCHSRSAICVLRPAPREPTSVTIVFINSSTPERFASASRPSRTSRARSETGNSFALSDSSLSGMPTSLLKNAFCSPSGHERRILRRVFGEELVTNRASSSREGRMLHRPPPLIRILRPPSAVRSTSVVLAPLRAAKIAAIVPAAPAPMTTTRGMGQLTAYSHQLSAWRGLGERVDRDRESGLRNRSTIWSSLSPRIALGFRFVLRISASERLW